MLPCNLRRGRGLRCRRSRGLGRKPPDGDATSTTRVPGGCHVPTPVRRFISSGTYAPSPLADEA